MTAWPRTLHARLTFGYAIAFFAGLMAFAAISYASLDTALRKVVDAPLHVAGLAVAQILVTDPTIDHATRERLELAVGPNQSGVVFSAPEKAVFSSVISIRPSTREMVLHAGEQPQLVTVRIDGATARIITQRIVTNDGSYAYVGVWRQTGLVEELKRLALVIFAVAVIVIGGSAVFVGALVAREGLKPLRAVATLASEIEAHDLSRRLGAQSDTSELGRLSLTFDRMLERMQSAFERQRRFTADASHELRAPLSVIHIAADLALRREREPAAYRRVLSSILRATQQLEDLTDRLLTAARADAGQVRVEQVDFSVVVAEALEQLTPLAESKNIRIASHLQPSMYMNGDRAGIARVVVALLDNAIKYSPTDAIVVASLVQDGDDVRLTLQDDGPGFSDEGLEHATDRFWRHDAARAPGSGSGLGLAISDSIVRASGGTLILQNADGHGARVIVAFPSATVTVHNGVRA